MTQPKLFPIPFANSGEKNNILPARVAGDVSQKVNLAEGFPPVTEQPKSAGGKAPLRKDFNGVLFQLTDNAKYLQTGVAYYFDGSFASAIGGYPEGAILLSNNNKARYISLVNGNTSDFNVSVDPLKWAKTSMTEAQVRAAHGCVRFVSNGSFTVPDGVYGLFVSASAGGGGGGGGAGSSGTTTGVGGGGGGGGGAGQSVVKAHLAVTPGGVLPVVIGAGGIAGVGSGSAGTNGGDGGITSIGALLSLSGGIGGKRGALATRDVLPDGGGAGGLGGAGDPEGADGTDGNYMGCGGAGASSPFGGGGASGRAGAGSAGVSTYDGGFAGTVGGGFGTGGGGGGASYGKLSGKGGAGGTGARGIVIIEW